MRSFFGLKSQLSSAALLGFALLVTGCQSGVRSPAAPSSASGPQGSVDPNASNSGESNTARSYGPVVSKSPKAAVRDSIDLYLGDSPGSTVFAFVGAIRELKKNKIALGTVFVRDSSQLAAALFAGSKNLNKLDWNLLELRKVSGPRAPELQSQLEELKKNTQGMIAWKQVRFVPQPITDYGIQEILDHSQRGLLILRLSSQPEIRGIRSFNSEDVFDLVIPVEGIDPERFSDQGESIYRGGKFVKEQISRIQKLFSQPGIEQN